MIKKCIICSKEFETNHDRQKTCSPLCSKERNNRNNVKIRAKQPYITMRFNAFKRDNFTCQYCGRCIFLYKIILETDHILPKSKDGKDELDNIITCCSDCNQGKMDKLLSESQMNLLKQQMKRNEIC